MAQPTVTLTVRIPPELDVKLRAAARDQSESVNTFVTRTLKKRLATYEIVGEE